MNTRTVLLWSLGLLILVGTRAAADPTETAGQAFDLRLAGKVDEAVQLLEKELAVDSEQAILLYELARTKMFLMDFEGMQKAVEKAAALDSENPDIHYFAGMASAYSLINAAHQDQEEQMKDFAEKIVAELEAAVRCDPDHHAARCMLVQQMSVMAEGMGWDLGRAEEHVTILEQKNPVMGTKARANLVPEDQRVGLWEKVIQEQPDEWLACYEAGEGFIDAGQLDRAVECIDKAIALNPERSYILLRLGMAFAMVEKWDQAVAITHRYISLKPPVPLEAFAWARLGQFQQRMGNAVAGQELMTKATEMDPHLWRGFMPPPEEIFTRP